MSDRRGHLAAFCLLGLAALQIPVLTTGFTVSGDDFEGLGKALQGPWTVLAWGVEVVERDGRLGALTIFPLNALGAWLAGNEVARLFMALAHVGVAAMFGIWLARAWAPAAGALAFVAWCALHPVGVPHLPPHAFPMQLAPVFLLIMGAHLLMREGDGRRGLVAAALLFPGLAAHEYGLLFGAAIIGAGWLLRFLKAGGGIGERLRKVLATRATRLEAGVLLCALIPLAAYRLWSGGAYEGVSGDGLAYPGRMALAALGHVAASTSLMELHPRLLDVPWPGASAAVLRAVLAGAAVLLLMPRLRIDGRAGALTALFALASLGLFTLPVVSALKQQRWCLDNGDCAYLDARMAILPLAFIVVLVLAALPARRTVYGAAAGLMALLAAVTGLENAWEVEHRLKPLTRPWERAATLACLPGRAPETDAHLARVIDPWGHIASHSYVDVGAIWRQYVDSFDPARDCPLDGPTPEAAARILPVLAVGASDSVGRGDGTAGRFLVEGWHRVEPWGVWSSVPEAQLVVRVVEPRAAPGPVALRLDWSPAPFPDGRVRPVTLRLGREVLWQGTGERGEGGCCTARLPLPTPLPETLEVTFAVPEMHDIAPSVSGGKPVGIGLRKIALEPLD
ncbi:MAG: hypothetical protein AAF371_08665 [Pseudomonadota bacterium]